MGRTADATRTITLHKLGHYRLLPLHLALGLVFTYHGIEKLRDVHGFAEMMGLPYMVAVAVTAAELSIAVLAIASMFGRPLFGRIAGALAILVMTGAIARVHWPRWSFTPADGFPMGGMEFQVTICLVGLALLWPRRTI